MLTRRLLPVLQRLAALDRWCLSEATLRTFIPETTNTFRVAMSRHVRSRTVKRVAPGLYLNPFLPPPPWALEKLASHLRPDDLFYLSLESALHEHGRISQIPSRLTVMTSGRTYTYATPLGVVEFVHTTRAARAWRARTQFVPARKIHVASPELALEDLRRVGRNLELVESE